MARAASGVYLEVTMSRWQSAIAGRAARRCGAVALAVALGIAASGPSIAGGAGNGDPCLTADPPATHAPSRRLRFGITPQLAGTVGTAQGAAVAESAAKRIAALRKLRPAKRVMVVRLNRLFMSDGVKGIRRFARLARRYGRAGFRVESQVRYHPRAEQEGDMRKWRRFVRRAARALARNRKLAALTITNEVNLPLSANTSDGAFDGATDAIVAGVPAARRALNRAGRRGVKLGFSFAYRYAPNSDSDFFHEIGAKATPRFRKALDYVGMQMYPGLFWPPVLLTQTTGEAALEGLTLLRSCWMPKAGLGRGVRIWVTENGFATNLGHSEARQASELADTVGAIHAYSRTLGISDYRYFNLRDNKPDGTDLFDDVGLLRSDYSAKPSFAVYRELVHRLGKRR